MKKKGSITVFLSLILLLVFSFVLTALEAARIRGATAYVSMLSELAGDSFLASYYYPLFKEYRLFGVNRGDEQGFFEESRIKTELQETVLYGTEGVQGGLLRFRNTEVELTEHETMLSDEGKAFLSQVKQQAALDGVSFALEEIFSEEMFTEAGLIGEIYQKQEDALAETATITEELLQLMELVDGISMGKQGIAFDADGKMQQKDSFIKQLVIMEQEEVKASYDSEELFRAISSGFFRADRAAGRIQNLLSNAEGLQDDIDSADSLIATYQTELALLETKWKAEKQRLQQAEQPEYTELLRLEQAIEQTKQSINTAEGARNEYKEQRDSAISDTKEEYNNLKQKLDAVKARTEEALAVLGKLEKKQLAAQVAVRAYGTYLEGIKDKITEGLYKALEKELNTMKAYAGLEDAGFSVDTMRQSLETDKRLLGDLALAGFSESKLSQVADEMNRIRSRMKEYTVNGLWFSYGEIQVAETTADIVTDALSDLLTTGVLSLVGIDGDNVSDASVSGVDLPSAGLEKETIVEELMTCIEEVKQLLQGKSIGDALRKAGNRLLEETALELYATKYFHSFGEEASYTKLKYEREYLLFGADADKTNLLYMVLYLVAIQTLFAMTMILQQPDRMASLEALTAGVAGFTGMPVLAAVVKYSLLLLWSVEEALVQVSALLLGKRIAVVSTGMVSFGEIFLCGKTLIAKKAQLVPAGAGAAYKDYLALLSLMQGTKKKAYRAMDLIQENIRYRYKSSFRIRNLVTAVSFDTSAELEEQFDTGILPETAYLLHWETEAAY